jgi:hypothetical protein
MGPHGVSMGPHGVSMGSHGVSMGPHGAAWGWHGAAWGHMGLAWGRMGLAWAAWGRMGMNLQDPWSAGVISCLASSMAVCQDTAALEQKFAPVAVVVERAFSQEAGPRERPPLLR